MKEWYLRRLRMMEAALQEERTKNDPNAKPLPSVIDAEHAERKSKPDRKGRPEHDEAYLEIIKSAQTGLLERAGRVKSRAYLEKCLMEVVYLVNSEPTITANRPVDQESSQQQSAQPSSSQQETHTATSDDSQVHMGGPRPMKDRDGSAPDAPLRRQPSPAPEFEIQSTPLQVTNGNHSIDLGRAVNTEPFTGDPASNTEEDIEQIQHTFDSQGQFIETSSVTTRRADQVLSGGDKSWQATEDSWDFGDATEVSGSEHRMVDDDSQTQFALKHVLRGHLDSVRVACAVFGDNHSLWVASAGADSTIKLHRAPDPEPVVTLRAHTETITSLLFSADEEGESGHVTLYSAGEDLVIHKWSLDLTALQRFTDPVKPAMTFVSHSKGILGLALVKKQLVSISADSTIRLWNMDQGTSRAKWSVLRDDAGVTPTSICSLSDETFAVGQSDGRICTYNINKHEPVKTLPLGEETNEDLSRVNCLGYMSRQGEDNLLIAGCENAIVSVYNLATSRRVRSIPAHTARIATLCSVGSQIVSGSDDASIRVWTLAGTCTQELSMHRSVGGGGVNDVTYVSSPDASVSYLISAGADGLVKVSALQ